MALPYKLGQDAAAGKGRFARSQVWRRIMADAG